MFDAGAGAGAGACAGACVEVRFGCEKVEGSMVDWRLFCVLFCDAGTAGPDDAPASV